MDKEFHYYLTYLTAARAGFSFNDALLIAQSCQAVDDNNKIFEINPAGPNTYQNYISQTMDILRPRASRMRIYPVFHFIPGDSQAPSARRADENNHILNTTPDSELANQCFNEAAETNNLMEIGIACHAYADTWAHQNFIGFKDEFNNLTGFINELIPSIGHADAKHKPDLPALIWTDNRLINELQSVNNKDRFLNAAKRLYEKLCNFLNHEPSDVDCKFMINDFDLAIGHVKEGPDKKAKQYRIDRYMLLAERPEYNGVCIPDLDLDEWQSGAIKKDLIINYSSEPDEYFDVWRNPNNFSESKWFRFQEAVKSYQRRTLELYEETVYSQLDPVLLEKIMKFV